MFQIVYLSFTTDNFDLDSPETGIDNILSVAREYNSQNNITGMLLFKGGVFLQILEGDQQAVEELFAKIEQDPRHHKIKHIIKQENKERIFQEWTMAFKKVEDLELELINAILPWSEIMKKNSEGEPISNEKILEIFKKFRYQLKKD